MICERAIMSSVLFAVVEVDVEPLALAEALVASPSWTRRVGLE